MIAIQRRHLRNSTGPFCWGNRRRKRLFLSVIILCWFSEVEGSGPSLDLGLHGKVTSSSMPGSGVPSATPGLDDTLGPRTQYIVVLMAMKYCQPGVLIRYLAIFINSIFNIFIYKIFIHCIYKFQGFFGGSGHLQPLPRMYWNSRLPEEMQVFGINDREVGSTSLSSIPRHEPRAHLLTRFFRE